MRPHDATIRRLAEAQSGVMTRRQLIEEGLPARVVAQRLGSGALIALHRGVYAYAHLALPRDAPWRAAVWSCDDERTWLSHHQAATLLGQWTDGEAGEAVHVTTLGGARSTPGRVVHRVTHLDAKDVTVRDGIPVTSPLRTLVDLSRVLTYQRFRGLVDAQRVVDLDGLDRAAFRAGGASAVSRLLRNDAPHTRSAFERRFARWCRAQGIAPPDGTNVRIGPDTVDALHRAANLVVELDGRAHHERRAQMRADRQRDQRLQLRGLRVVRLVWEDLDSEFTPATARMLRRFLEGSGV